jgi:cell filamentation protein
LPTDPYVYPGTHVLKNSFGIRDQAELDRLEADIVGLRFRRLLVNGISGDLSPDWHKNVHRELFRKVYPFAGEYRTTHIEKLGEAPYASPDFLADNAAVIFRDLASKDYLRGLSPVEFRHEIARVMGELHVLHPFREGNTRTLQVTTFEIAARAGHHLDWRRLDPKTIRPAGTAAAFENYLPYERILASIMDDSRSLRQATERASPKDVPLSIADDRDEVVREAIAQLKARQSATFAPTIVEEDVSKRKLVCGRVLLKSEQHVAIATGPWSFAILDRRTLTHDPELQKQVRIQISAGRGNVSVSDESHETQTRKRRR